MPVGTFSLKFAVVQLVAGAYRHQPPAIMSIMSGRTGPGASDPLPFFTERYNYIVRHHLWRDASSGQVKGWNNHRLAREMAAAGRPTDPAYLSKLSRGILKAPSANFIRTLLLATRQEGAVVIHWGYFYDEEIAAQVKRAIDDRKRELLHPRGLRGPLA